MQQDLKLEVGNLLIATVASEYLVAFFRWSNLIVSVFVRMLDVVLVRLEF